MIFPVTLLHTLSIPGAAAAVWGKRNKGDSCSRSRALNFSKKVRVNCIRHLGSRWSKETWDYIDLINLFSCGDSHVLFDERLMPQVAAPPMMYPQELDDSLHREFLDAEENETQKFTQLKNMRDASVPTKMRNQKILQKFPISTCFCNLAPCRLRRPNLPSLSATGTSMPMEKWASKVSRTARLVPIGRWCPRIMVEACVF